MATDLNKDAALQIENRNKAAGTRARKTTLKLEKLLKELRKTSLKESKKSGRRNGINSRFDLPHHHSYGSVSGGSVL